MTGTRLEVVPYTAGRLMDVRAPAAGATWAAGLS